MGGSTATHRPWSQSWWRLCLRPLGYTRSCQKHLRRLWCRLECSFSFVTACIVHARNGCVTGSEYRVTIIGRRDVSTKPSHYLYVGQLILSCSSASWHLLRGHDDACYARRVRAALCLSAAISMQAAERLGSAGVVVQLHQRHALRRASGSTPQRMQPNYCGIASSCHGDADRRSLASERGVPRHAQV